MAALFDAQTREIERAYYAFLNDQVCFFLNIITYLLLLFC